MLQQNVKITCDSILEQENLSKYNVIIIPGGKGIAEFSDKKASKLISFCKKNKDNPALTFCGICASPTLFVE